MGRYSMNMRNCRDLIGEDFALVEWEAGIIGEHVRTIELIGPSDSGWDFVLGYKGWGWERELNSVFGETSIGVDGCLGPWFR